MATAHEDAPPATIAKLIASDASSPGRKVELAVDNNFSPLSIIEGDKDVSGIRPAGGQYSYAVNLEIDGVVKDTAVLRTPTGNAVFISKLQAEYDFYLNDKVDIRAWINVNNLSDNEIEAKLQLLDVSSGIWHSRGASVFASKKAAGVLVTEVASNILDDYVDDDLVVTARLIYKDDNGWNYTLPRKIITLDEVRE